MTTFPPNGDNTQANDLARKLAAAERLMAAAQWWRGALSAGNQAQAEAEVNAALAEWQTVKAERVPA